MRRDDCSGVSPVVAIILLVAITVVLTSFLYAIVIGIAQQAEAESPTIFIGNQQTPDSETTTYSIVGVSKAMPLSDYQLKLFISNSEDVGSSMHPVAPTTRGNLTFVDLDAGGTLSQGDWVSIRTASGYEYELLLFWKGTLAHSVRWRA